MDPIKLCSLCQNSIIGPPIEFSCKHSICLSCFPYVFYHRLISIGFNSRFFEENLKEFECPICKKKSDKMTIPFNDMINATKKYLDSNIPKLNKSEILLCEACLENYASSCCIDCQNQNYCDECLSKIHQVNKKFSKHKIIKIDEKETLLESKDFQSSFVCRCNRKMDFYCQQCNRAMCVFCLKIEENHEGHKFVSLESIADKIKDIDQTDVLGFLRKCLQEFDNFQIKSMNSYEKGVLQSIEEINICFERIAKKMQSLQNSMLNTLNEHLKTTRNHFHMIELSLNFMEKELEKEKIFKNKLHPNKLPLLINFFSSENFNPKSALNVFNDFQIINIRNFNLEKIENILDKELLNKRNLFLYDYANGRIQITRGNNNIFNFDEINFCSDIQKILMKEPIVIEEGTFNPKWTKSNVSTSFLLDDETFLIWPGYKEVEGSSIHIFNLSLMKKEIILKGRVSSMITVLSHYPKKKIQSDLQIFNKNKRYLYFSDDLGSFKLFGLSKQDRFQEILKIETKFGKGITSCIVFEDLYSEIIRDKTKKMSQDAYVVFSFNDANLPLLIYKIDGENAGSIIKEIVNPCKEKCFSMNYYYDEELSKCFLLCGFKGCVKIYDLTLNQWISKEFKTDMDYVTSLEIFKKKVKQKEDKFEIKQYLFVGLWGKKNNLMLCDITSSKILSTITIPKTEFFRDIVLWRHNEENDLNSYALIGCKNSNSIKMVTKFEELKISDFSKETGLSCPTNLRKVLIKDKNSEFLRENLVVLKWEKDQSQILLYC